MAQVKISNLSVGEWVQDKEGTPAKILGIEQWSGEYYLNVEVNGVDVGNVIAEGALPILITPEILEKNGFIKNGVYNEWNIGEWNERPFIGVSLDRQCLRVKHFSNDIFIEGKELFVHQLQHALRLAGVEKEIVV